MLICSSLFCIDQSWQVCERAVTHLLLTAQSREAV